MPLLSEAEQKIVIFMSLLTGSKYFYHDMSYTWYYKGRQIRMGEIPPLPPSMQQPLPEQGKDIFVEFAATKQDDNIVLTTNLPEQCEVFASVNNSGFSQKLLVSEGKMVIIGASNVKKVIIDSGVFSSDCMVQKIIGDKCRNLVGKYVKYNPIFGNQLMCTFEF
ncbi:hypothetical protein H8S23_09695 [Anaerofilum sp. BX8]|uniref:Uncharacterized protein n=1 Tax=Anaerofilum hominis TaxID=2763016 RepID=A0A923I8G9_9FIRM|nr:hypothetical protein [Anaerofilum hominis]MBC5581779.1 hypothetical protein [Anaerofilum hominis]